MIFNSAFPREQSDDLEDSWENLATERSHPASHELDTLSTGQIVTLLLDEDRRGLEATMRRTKEIALAADWLAETFRGRGRIVLTGAGTSGRLAVIEAAECPPTFGTDPERIKAVIAGGPEAVFEAREGAEDSVENGQQAALSLQFGDLLIALSASSVTPFARAALDAAHDQGARTILLTCAPLEGLDGAADLVIALDTGEEILTGSTRLKAGSATKAALNAITTAAMVRDGKVFGNLMVDLRPGSAKLRDRSLRIIARAGSVSREQARRLQAEADGEVKTAIVMARCNLGAQAARRVLRHTQGHVRPAIADPSGGEP